MIAKWRNALDLFIVITGVVLTFQLVIASSSVRPIGFEGLGILSKETVLAIILLIITLSICLVALSLLEIRPGLVPCAYLSRFRLLPLAAGAELIVLGLASINLSRYVNSGTTASIMPVGIELFSMGMISIALFVQNAGTSCVFRNLPNYTFLIFFMSLLPAALLITT